jgi:hypothetical protein
MRQRRLFMRQRENISDLRWSVVDGCMKGALSMASAPVPENWPVVAIFGASQGSSAAPIGVLGGA